MYLRTLQILRSFILAITFVLVVQACSTTSTVDERFSEATATTWRVAGSTMVFERTEARFSRSTRDYVYLGPVAINRRGSYEYLLWIGVGSTLDRGFLAPQITGPDSISIFVNDEPLQLALIEWEERAPALAEETPYDPPVPVNAQLAARVTLDQIDLMDSRSVDRVILHAADGTTREFFPWDEEASWQTFVSVGP